MDKRIFDRQVASVLIDQLSRRDFLRLSLTTAAAAALAACSPAASTSEENELIVGSWGGVWDESTQKHIIDPLVAETGAKVQIIPGNSVDHYAKLIAEPDNPPFDVLWFDLDYVAPLAVQDSFLPLDPNEIPNLKNVYENLKFYKGQAVAGNFGVVGLVYDSDLLPSVDSWQLLWDPTSSCKITLPHFDGWAMQWLILADKLAGGDGSDLNQGIEKTKSLAPNIVALLDDYDVRPMFERKEVALSCMYTGEAKVMYDAGVTSIKVAKPKEGGVIVPNCLVIPKNAKHPNLAKKFIDYALAKASQEGFLNDYASVPSSSTAEIPEDMKPWLFTGDEITPLILPDYNVVLKEKDAMAQRWDGEVVPLIGKSCG